MSGRFFLDTNVFVFSVTTDTPDKKFRALDLIERAIRTGKGIVSYQVVQEFFNVALRRYSQPMSYAECEEYLSTTFRPLLAVHSSHVLYGHALALNRRYSLSWYDALIVAAAAEGDCDLLYSEDLQHGQSFGKVTVENPFL